MLKFIGSGSAFNTKLGNTSAYYKESNQLFLIDCGSNIFQRIKESNLLDGVDNIHVLVTHTHADHIGSLADLILYTYYSHGEMMKVKTDVYSVSSTKIKEILTLTGVIEGEHYNFNPMRYTVESKLKQFESFTIADIQKNDHVEEIPSFGYVMYIDNKIVYYSGDTSSLTNSIRGSINNKYFDYAFIDTCNSDYEGNVHLSLRKLNELIALEARESVYCMHLDENFNREEAENLGFNVVVNEY